MSAEKSVLAEIPALKQKVASGDLAGANAIVRKCKLAMVGFQAGQGLGASTQVLEEAVLLAAVAGESEAFDRDMQQLKSLYFDFKQLGAAEARGGLSGARGGAGVGMGARARFGLASWAAVAAGLGAI